MNDLQGGIPFVFPICARISRNAKEGVYLYDGKQYPLKIHGFSWFEKWIVMDESKNSLTVVLTENENTLRCYPFRFEIRLTYQVTAGKLTCYQRYTNTDDKKSMPYYAGFHPYFLTPAAGSGKENVFIDFKSTRRLQYNDTLTDIMGETSALKTPISVGNPDMNEQLNWLNEDKTVTITFPNGECLQMNAYGIQDPNLFSYLQLYTIPEKPFVCAEPWMSFPNAMNTVSGVRWLKPLESEEGMFEIKLGT